MRYLLIAAMAASLLAAQTKKIVFMGGTPEQIADYQAVTNKAKIVGASRETLLKEIVDADAVIGDPRAEHIRAAKKLQWVQTRSAGVENVLHLSGGNDLRDSAAILTNNQIVQGPEIADHAMAMLLTMSRGLLKFIEDRKSETWQGRPYPGIELNTKNAVVIGVGGIGMQIATRAWAFGMNVTGVDPEDIPFSPFLKKVVKPDQLDEVLPTADVVFISAPHTPRSHKMMGPKQFELMKKGSYFIAVSRGGIYDINGLVKALDSQHIAGAGVDVTDPEPLPKGHPLWKFSNVIVTPHIAGRSDLDTERMNNTVKENIRRFVDGKPLLNVVDKQKGY